MKRSSEGLARAGHRAFTLVELMVVVGIIGVLVSLLLPAVNASREAARRFQCQNNLMQLGIALHSYDSVHETLPPGAVSELDPVLDLPRGYGFGWMFQVSPYLELGNVFHHFNVQVGLYQPANATTRTHPVHSFLCPSDRGPIRGPGRVAMTSYAGVHHDVEAPIAADNHGVLFLNSRVRYEDVTDGTSQTAFVGEKLLSGSDLGWASGSRASLRNGGLLAAWAGGPIAAGVKASQTPSEDLLFVGGFSSAHPGVLLFLIGDGSVRVIVKSSSPGIMQRLTHRADGEPIDASTFGY